VIVVGKRWLLPAVAVFGLVVGPISLFNGVGGLDRDSTIGTIGDWFLIVGGVLMLAGGALALIGLLRETRPDSRTDSTDSDPERPT
jgi:hypothetical protein